MISQLYHFHNFLIEVEMEIKKVLSAVGRSGYLHIDLAAVRAGAKPNGGIYEGQPITPGFTKIVQAANVLSVMLLLDDGQVAHGDCADVIFAGASGRASVFDAGNAVEALSSLEPFLTTLNPLAFRKNSELLDSLDIHIALKYGISQALLHAAALARRETMAEVVASEYRCPMAKEAIPLLANCQNNDIMQIDRMIIKRVELLPHAYFTSVKDELGQDGKKLIAWVQNIAHRIREIGDEDYQPKIHIDVYGTIGELFHQDTDAMAGYIGMLEDAVAPYSLLVESPIIAETRSEQLTAFGLLRQALEKRGVAAEIVVDEWCNTLEDIKLFADAKAAHHIQVKTPDLGCLHNTIEAVLYCRERGVGVCLGGTGNETDQSTRITTHIGLACQPSFMLAKPGLGGDEALMIQSNEMARTFARISHCIRLPTESDFH